MSKPFEVQDKYFKKAKDLGYRARSVFKLEEINNKFNLLRPGVDVLDLGAAPGSWLQYTAKITGSGSKLFGIDLTPIAPIAPNVTTLAADIFSPEAESFIFAKHKKSFLVILSDLAPSTSGVKEADHYRSIELNTKVVELAHKFLDKKGSLVMKVFQGPDFDNFIKDLKNQFRQVSIFKPKACRDRSFEVYVIAQKLK